MKCRVDIIEENMPKILDMLLTQGKAHPEYFKDMDELVSDLFYIFRLEGGGIVRCHGTYNCFIEYMRQALLPGSLRISSRVPTWYEYFKRDIPFIGRDYHVPSCFRRSVFYHPLRTGMSPKKLLECMGYKSLLEFKPTSRERHLLVMYASSLVEFDVLSNLLELRGSVLQDYLRRYDLYQLTPGFVKWVGKDISRAEKCFQAGWPKNIHDISELRESDYFGNPSPETLRRRLDARIEQRRLDIERRSAESVEDLKRRKEALLAAKFEIPYPDGEYVKPIRNGQQLKSWAEMQQNCIFENHQLIKEQFGEDGFFVRITRSKSGSTALLRRASLDVLEILGASNRRPEECDKRELEKWISAIESGEISKNNPEKQIEMSLNSQREY